MNSRKLYKVNVDNKVDAYVLLFQEELDQIKNNEIDSLTLLNGTSVNAAFISDIEICTEDEPYKDLIFVINKKLGIKEENFVYSAYELQKRNLYILKKCEFLKKYPNNWYGNCIVKNQSCCEARFLTGYNDHKKAIGGKYNSIDENNENNGWYWINEDYDLFHDSISKPTKDSKVA